MDETFLGVVGLVVAAAGIIACIVTMVVVRRGRGVRRSRR